MSCMLTIRHEFCGLTCLVGRQRGPMWKSVLECELKVRCGEGISPMARKPPGAPAELWCGFPKCPLLWGRRTRLGAGMWNQWLQKPGFGGLSTLASMNLTPTTHGNSAAFKIWITSVLLSCDLFCTSVGQDKM